MENNEDIPKVKKIRCRRCQFFLPDLIVHGYGRLDDREEPSVQYLIQCNRCRLWHRFDTKSNIWIADERAEMLGKTRVPKELLK